MGPRVNPYVFLSLSRALYWTWESFVAMVRGFPFKEWDVECSSAFSFVWIEFGAYSGNAGGIEGMWMIM